MKAIFLFLFCIFSCVLWSQDTIQFLDFSKLECKVLKVETNTIQYSLPKDESLYIARKSEVIKIIYSDGRIEEFPIAEIKNDYSIEDDVYLEEKKKKQRHPILGSGLFLEILTGVAFGRRSDQSLSNANYSGQPITWKNVTFATFGGRFGLKRYKKKHLTRRFGFAANLVELMGAFSQRSIPELQISVWNVGITNIFQLNEKSGIEYTSTIGPVARIRENNGTLDVKFLINSRYRLNQFMVGIEYGYAHNFPYNFGTHHLNTTIGYRF